jgi:F-type H+-transporting ATPase subunit epsilon
MKLEVISLKGVQFEGEVSSVNLKTTSGEITVLDKHRPLITSLVRGKATVIKKDGDRLNFDINSGFFEVGQGNEATILIS